MSSESTQNRAGLACAVLAHIMWGLFPLFWRQLRAFDPLEVVSYRVLWAWVILVCCLPLLLTTTPAARLELRQSAREWKVWAIYAVAALLIYTNWLTFIWAVGHDRVLEASLGYYINPLLNVVLGVLVVREKLARAQWLAVAVAAVGVSIMTAAGSGLPWIALVLALTFSLYGLVKKWAPLPALLGLLIESSILLGPAVLLLALLEPAEGVPVKDLSIWILLILGGLITVMPLALFAYAAQRVPLSTLGILQYIGPTLQFIIGAWILSEPFGAARWVGFAFIWAALAIYVVGSGKRQTRATSGHLGTAES